MTDFNFSIHYKNLALIISFFVLSTVSINTIDNQQNPDNIAIERTQSFALIYSFIQCFPNVSTRELDRKSRELFEIHKSFNPENHLNDYTNEVDIRNLITSVENFKKSGKPNNLPFTNAPSDIAELERILKVLYHNSDDWPLFYNTSIWLLQRVNVAQLYWALTIVAADKFNDTVIVPSVAEILPQLYLRKDYVLEAAGIHRKTPPQEHLLHYWMSDPLLNDFHTHWHLDNAFWWTKDAYGVTRDRRGELFLYMHHQILNRYNAERLCNGMGIVEPLGFHPDDKILEGFDPDIVHLNYVDMFSRKDGKKIGDFDDGTLLPLLRKYNERLNEGFNQGFLLGRNGAHVSILKENGTDIVGNTIEVDPSKSANFEYYGNIHGFMHRLLAGLMRLEVFGSPGVTAYPATGIRDPAFYQIHTRIDVLYSKYKSKLPSYEQDELDFPYVSIKALKINTKGISKKNYHSFPEDFQHQPPILITYFRKEIFDISNAARPCRLINDKPVPVAVKVLDHAPFTYTIDIISKRSTVTFGMVRIFMWPKYTHDGKLLQGDAAHERAIELDRFRVQIDPGKEFRIKRSSLDSSLSSVESAPGIKELYKKKYHGRNVKKSIIRRACGYPHSLLLPRGSKEGIPFIIAVYVSEESDETPEDYPNYPLCGALHGLPFPDSRPMGFPYDRPGTRFTRNPECSAHSCSGVLKNYKEIEVLIKHTDQNNLVWE